MRGFVFSGVERDEDCKKRNMLMKLFKSVAGVTVLSGALLVSTLAFAADQAKPADAKSAKPYPLKTCIVSDEKLDGDMGKPYVFVDKGQEIKLCCKGCLKDYQKDPAKYLKKLADAKKSGKGAGASAPSHEHSEPKS
jgi:hypothetical protein